LLLQQHLWLLAWTLLLLLLHQRFPHQLQHFSPLLLLLLPVLLQALLYRHQQQQQQGPQHQVVPQGAWASDLLLLLLGLALLV
jgi:hypothetical protein